MKINEIGSKLARLFLGRIVIKELSSTRRLNVQSGLLSKQVNIVPVRSTPRVNAACFVKWRTMECQGVNTWSAKGNAIEVKSMAFAPHKGALIKKFTFRQAGRVKDGIKRIMITPHERANRIQFMKNKPSLDRAVILGLFSPVMQNMLKRSYLDKKTGKLLLLYGNPYKGELPQHLALFRFAANPADPLKWVWLPMQKIQKK